MIVFREEGLRAQERDARRRGAELRGALRQRGGPLGPLDDALERAREDEAIDVAHVGGRSVGQLDGLGQIAALHEPARDGVRDLQRRVGALDGLEESRLRGGGAAGGRLKLAEQEARLDVGGLARERATERRLALGERAQSPGQRRVLHAAAQRLGRGALERAQRLERDGLRVFVGERRAGGAAQRLERGSAVVPRVREVRAREVALDAGRRLERALDLPGGVVETAEAHEQLSELGAHLGGVFVERQRALQLGGRVLPALLLLVEERARDVLVRLGAHGARHDDPVSDEPRDGPRPGRAARGDEHAEGRREPSSAGHRHKGMFPCFLGGFESRFVPTAASARARRARVSRGRMTSST